MSDGDAPQEPVSSAAAAVQAPSDADQADVTQMTCDVLCSLGTCSPVTPNCKEALFEEGEMCDEKAHKSSIKGCLKQHQLPMFLSSKCYQGRRLLVLPSLDSISVVLLF